MLEDVLEESETKSISDNEKNLENIQHEEILNKRNSQRDEEVMKLECDLKSRVQNLQHN
jgi:ribonuclease I